MSGSHKRYKQECQEVTKDAKGMSGVTKVVSLVRNVASHLNSHSLLYKCPNIYLIDRHMQQCRPRLDCSFRSSLIRVYTFCLSASYF